MSDDWDWYSQDDDAERTLLEAISAQCADFLARHDSERITATYEHIGRTLARIGTTP